MDIRILILRNRNVNVKIDDDIEKWKNYEQERLGVNLLVDTIEVDIQPLDHKTFGVNKLQGDVTREMYGLSDIKERVRKLDRVPQYVYHAVIFLYNVEETILFKSGRVSQIGHWTYFSPLYTGTYFIEIATRQAWDERDDVFRVLTHEFRHSLVFRLRGLGNPIVDVMDSTPKNINCDNHKIDSQGLCINDFPYYKEFDVHATDGNRADQDALLLPLIHKLKGQPELKNFLQVLLDQITTLWTMLQNLLHKKEEKNDTLLIKWAEAIKRHEGWFVGSRSYRNNNPGNFRFTDYLKSLGAVGADANNYSIFKTFDAGWGALLQFLRDAQANELRAYRLHAQAKGREIPTLRDFFEVYAPSADSNNPLHYAEVVAEYIGEGVTVDTPINQI